MCKCFKIYWSPKPFVPTVITFVLVSNPIYTVGGGWINSRSRLTFSTGHSMQWPFVTVFHVHSLLLSFAVLSSRCDGFVHCSYLTPLWSIEQTQYCIGSAHFKIYYMYTCMHAHVACLCTCTAQVSGRALTCFIPVTRAVLSCIKSVLSPVTQI